MLRRTLAALTATALAAAGLSLASPAVAAPELVTVGSFAGTVTGSTGAPLEGVNVAIRQSGQVSFTEKAVTDANGEYDFSLDSGTYSLRFEPTSGRWAPEFSGNTYDKDLALEFTVVGNATVEVDAVLARSTRVSGLVVDSSGNPVEGAELNFGVGEGFSTGITRTYSDVTGAYLFNRVADVTASLSVEKEEEDRGTVYYPDTYLFDDREMLRTGTGADLELDDLVLRVFADASGTLTEGAESPTPSGTVVAYLRYANGEWESFRAASVLDGAWAMTGLPPTEVVFSFSSTSAAGFDAEYWSGHPIIEYADPVELAEDENRDDLDVTLTYSGTSNVSAGIVAVPESGKVGDVRDGSPTSGTTEGAELIYVWRRGDTEVQVGTDPLYTLQPEDVGELVSVQVRAYKLGWRFGLSGKRTMTEVVAPGDLVKTPTPKIRGTAKVGKKLTAKTGSWDSGVDLSYRWYRSGDKIGGSKGKSKSYKLRKADRGHKLTVQVTGELDGYLDVTEESAKTKKVRR